MGVVEDAAAAAAQYAKKPETHRDRSKRFYASLSWRRLRYKALAANAVRHGGKAHCDLCGATAVPGVPLDGDHIEPLSKNWARRLDSTNVQILCRPCNFGKGNRDNQDFRPQIDAEQGIAA